MPLSNIFNPTPTPNPLAGAPSGTQQVQQTLEDMLNPNSSYIQNARQRGVEYAAQRGGLNSSIAAGAAERSALEAVQPFVGQALDIDARREALIGQNWLDEQGFAREFQGQLAMLPAVNGFNMLSMVQQYALEDPSLYTPDVVSGFTSFFGANMRDYMSTFFGENT
jgi:hypothetical protein